MRFAPGKWQWYDLIIVALAAAIVYPDKILEWLSDATGKIFGWGHLVLLEVVTIGLMMLAMVLLMPTYPALVWWKPVMMVGVLAVIRIGVWLVVQMFGFDD